MTTKKKQVVKVTGDDWSGIYIDGKLVTEGHSIPFHDLMEVLTEHVPTGIDYWTALDVDDKWLQNEGSLPPILREVVFAADILVPACLIWGD